MLNNLALGLGSVGAEGGDVLKTTGYVVSESREVLANVWLVVQ